MITPSGQVVGRYIAGAPARYDSTDHLGSTRAVVASNETVVETHPNPKGASSRDVGGPLPRARCNYSFFRFAPSVAFGLCGLRMPDRTLEEASSAK
jgi:hypothetical protein